MAKRKRSAATHQAKPVKEIPNLLPVDSKSLAGASKNGVTTRVAKTGSVIAKSQIKSPTRTEVTRTIRRVSKTTSALLTGQGARSLQNDNVEDSDSPLSDLSETAASGGMIHSEVAPAQEAKAKNVLEASGSLASKSKAKAKNESVEAAALRDPEAEDEEDFTEEDEAEVNAASSRPPPVNSDYLPLPWKGRLGYVCFH